MGQFVYGRYPGLPRRVKERCPAHEIPPSHLNGGRAKLTLVQMDKLNAVLSTHFFKQPDKTRPSPALVPESLG